VIAELTEMTDGERTRILALIEKLKPLDNTNLWDGFKTGMDLLINNRFLKALGSTNAGQYK
jgi:hypothetical protein